MRYFLTDIGVFSSPVSTTGIQTVKMARPFLPKAIIAFGGGITGLPQATSKARPMIGITDLTTTRSVGCAMEDNVSPTECGSRQGTEFLYVLTHGSSALDESANFSAARVGEFDINWITSHANAFRYFYAALGGDDIEQIDVRTFDMINSGSKSITGLGWQPDMLIIISILTDAATATDAQLMIGMVASDGSECVTTFNSLGGQATSAADRYQRSSLCIANFDKSVEATHTSFDVGGYTFNFTTGDAVNRTYAVLATKGLRSKVIQAIQPATAIVVPTTGAGFRPELALLNSYGAPADTSPKTSAKLSIGVADAHKQMSMSIVEDDASNPQNNARSQEAAAVDIVNNATSLDVDTGYVSSLEDEGPSLNWVDVDGTQREINLLCLAGKAPSGETAFRNLLNDLNPDAIIEADGTDSTGNGHTLTLSGGVQSQALANPGIVGETDGWILDGSNDYLQNDLSAAPLTPFWLQGASFWPAAVPKNHVQGVASDGTHYYITQTLTLRIDKVRLSDDALIASNTDPLSGLSGSPNHLGDPEILDIDGNEYLVVPVEEFPGLAAGSKYIAFYNRSDLTRAFTVSGSDADELGSLVVINDKTIIVASFNQNTLYYYTAAGIYLRSVNYNVGHGTAATNTTGCQGICWIDPYLYLKSVRSPVLNQHGDYLFDWTNLSTSLPEGVTAIDANTIWHANEVGTVNILPYTRKTGDARGVTVAAMVNTNGPMTTSTYHAFCTLEADVTASKSVEFFLQWIDESSSESMKQIVNGADGVSDIGGSHVAGWKMCAVVFDWNQGASLFVEDRIVATIPRGLFPLAVSDIFWGRNHFNTRFADLIYAAPLLIFKRPLSALELQGLHNTATTGIYRRAGVMQ